MQPERLPGGGWLVLIGGGEFSFGETMAADAAWSETAPEGTVGFVPAASGSADYGQHFASYLEESFGRVVETIPIYRRRDALRGKNLQRLAEAKAVYLGGGVADHLLDALAGSPAEKVLRDFWTGGGVLVAIAAAAQACGTRVRSLLGREVLAGFGWLPAGAVEANFEPGRERRLRRLLEHPEVDWALALPSGSAVMLGPEGALVTIGESWILRDPEGELEALGEAEELDSQDVN